MQKHWPPSFFLANTTALHQALWLGLIVPDSSISCRWLWTSSTGSRRICLNHSLKGVSSVTFIMCLVEWVQPNSTGSNENTLWYLARSQLAASASPGGQESNLLKSSSLNSFPYLCLTVNLGVWGSWGSSPPLLQLSLHGWFGYWEHWNCPGHWGFLLEGLQVSCTVPYHHDCLFTSSPQLCVHVLYSEALQQRSLVCKACTRMLIHPPV